MEQRAAYEFEKGQGKTKEIDIIDAIVHRVKGEDGNFS